MNNPRTIITVIAPRTANFTALLPYFERLGAVETNGNSTVFIDAGRSVNPTRLRSKLVIARSVIQTMLGDAVRIGAGSNKTVSTIAARSTLPGGITMVRDGGEKEFLDRTPIDLLPGIGRRTATYLRNRGVQTIGKFSQLPQYVAVKLFGISGIVLHGYSGGTDPRQVLPDTRSQSFMLGGRQSLFSLLRQSPAS